MLSEKASPIPLAPHQIKNHSSLRMLSSAQGFCGIAVLCIAEIAETAECHVTSASHVFAM
jgi:hypothetical protein